VYDVMEVITVSSKQLLDFLRKGIELELQVSMRYMWQHIFVKGLDGAIVEKIFRDLAIVEMKHAEDLADRLALLNGVPPNQFAPVRVGSTLAEMLREDERTEEQMVTLYNQAIQLARKEGDFATARLLEEILTEEEKHLDKIGKLLVGMSSPFTQP
jgi:bacterioferritin